MSGTPRDQSEPEYFTGAGPAGIIHANHDGEAVESSYAVYGMEFVQHSAAHAEHGDRVRPLNRASNGGEGAMIPLIDL